MYAELILAIFSGVEQSLALAAKLRAAAQQSGEWTAEQEQAFNDRLASLRASDAWKTDAQVGQGN